MASIVKKLFSFALLLSLALASLSAQEPQGYYQSAEGLKQKALLQELCDIVGPHTQLSYKEVWSAYYDTDIRPGTSDRIWDMYSSTSDFRVGDDQCGNYTKEGVCYNREHSMPKSWFNDAYPMYSDVFHLYPTDGYVNGRRSNFPFGETDGETYTSNGGTSKVGSCTFSGYSGTVFEPADEYKGDFARTYFYMAACYNDRISSWNSPMLAGNNYPCYTTWAVNLLLKWNEQDPVSQKEIDRNNAIYKIQHNRNPFIDHPELADHIWGDKKNIGWTPGGAVTPDIITPVDGTTVDFGTMAVGRSVSKSIEVKAEGLTSDVTISVTGNGFSASSSRIAASSANNGTTLQLQFTAAASGNATGTLTLSSGEASSTVSLKAQAVDGIPALPATNVTSKSFTANWIDIDNDGSNYTLFVYYEDGATLLPSYPVEVAASAQHHDVAGLDYSTSYKYSLKNASGQTSNTVSVLTADIYRAIEIETPDEGLTFSATPNEASQPKTVTVYAENVEEDVIAVKATGGFQISENKTDWAAELNIDTRDAEQFGVALYVRMPAMPAGSHDGILSASTATLESPEIEISGTSVAPVTFFEDFEAETSKPNNYDGIDEYEGNACRWNLVDAGICNRSGDKKNGRQAVCTGKGETGTLTMLDDKQDGAGVFSFHAAPFGDDEEARVELSYSTDGGSRWTTLESFSIAASFLSEYSTNVNISGPIRFRLSQTSGERLNIDDIQITAYSSSAVEMTTACTWDAVCRNGHIEITTESTAEIFIYSIDARQVFGATVDGSASVALPDGYYIVVNGNDSRKVIVK